MRQDSRRGVTSYLAQGVDPNYWKEIPWWSGRYRGEELHLLLSKVSINGLSYTGSSQAKEVLARLKKKPFAERQLPNINEGIARNEKIGSMGLERYMKELATSRH